MARFGLIFLLSLLLLLSGCSSKESDDTKVSVFSPSHSGVYMSDDKAMDRISFIMRNDEVFEAECHVSIEMVNGTNTSVARRTVGVFQPGESKNVSVGLPMLEGNASLKISTDCVNP